MIKKNATHTHTKKKTQKNTTHKKKKKKKKKRETYLTTSRESLDPKLLPLEEDMPWPLSCSLWSKSSVNHVVLEDEARSVSHTSRLSSQHTSQQ